MKNLRQSSWLVSYHHIIKQWNSTNSWFTLTHFLLENDELVEDFHYGFYLKFKVVLNAISSWLQTAMHSQMKRHTMYACMEFVKEFNAQIQSFVGAPAEHNPSGAGGESWVQAVAGYSSQGVVAPSCIHHFFGAWNPLSALKLCVIFWDVQSMELIGRVWRVNILRVSLKASSCLFVLCVQLFPCCHISRKERRGQK